MASLNLDDVIQWHTPSAVYTCTAGVLLQVVSRMMESHPEICTDLPFLRLGDVAEKKRSGLRLKNICNNGMIILQAPKRKEEIYAIQDIGLKRWQEEIGDPDTSATVDVLCVKEEV